MTYRAPVRDLAFTLQAVAGIDQVAATGAFPDYDADLMGAVLEAAAQFSEGVLAPMNRIGDQKGSTWTDGAVTAAPGFADAYRQFAEGGWTGLSAPAHAGGQNLPKALELAAYETVHAANMAFGLCPMLSLAAIEALEAHGTPSQKDIYLTKLVSGEWTGAMVLTEPQAGSDLGALTTTATPDGDGTYRLNGQKIYITWGDHDATENIVHLVLARLPDAPPGPKGISLFLASKFLLNEDGSLGARNGFRAVGVEHKLGIHASPTCVMSYEGATAELVGQPNQGLAHMFIMMNAARYGVGVQGIAIAERAYQTAVNFSRERVQSRPVDGSLPTSGPIIHHPDVRRMLMTMRATTEGCRALASVAASAYDAAHHHPDPEVRKPNQAFYEFMVPLVKGYSTEMSLEVTSLAVQVHGGMGFIEETGVAQYYRDAKILTIYEGTTAIQANDLVGRKTARDGGQTAKGIAGQIAVTEAALRQSGTAHALAMAQRLQEGREAFLEVVDFVAGNTKASPNAVFAGSVPYLMLAGNLMAGWQLGRALLVAQDALAAGTDTAFMQAKVTTARFYADHVLTKIAGLRDSIVHGADSVTALALESF